MPIVNLTEKFIETSLVCPADKSHQEYCDRSIRGFIADVQQTSPGVATFKLRYKNGEGKTAYHKIGRSSEIDLKDARKEAKRLKAEIHLGRDPQAETRAKRQSMTWTEFVEDRYLPHAKQHKRTWRNDLDMHNLRVKDHMGSLRLNQITRHKVEQLHNEVKASGLAGATADHFVKFIRHALNLAVEWDLLDKNPAAKIKLFNEDNKLENYLDEEGLQRLVKVLRTHPNRVVCNVALFLLCTGARLNEALSARWQDLDRTNRVWRIPAETSKSRKVRSIPLNTEALAVLDQLGTDGTHEFLFISPRSNERLRYVHKVWGRIRDEAGLPHLRLHDLRHQYASFLVNSGRTLYEVQQILGHSDPTVTQRYAHLSTRSLQEAANTASDRISEAIKANG